MDLLLFLVVGLLAGWIASMIMGTNSSQGMLMDIVLGVLGAFIGGFLMNSFGQAGVTGFNLYSIVVATLGAVVLIALRRMFWRSAY